MEDSVAFSIKNLACEYVSKTPILRIKALDIPRSKLVFVIGKSGIGKSTFIETLGLMNKTIAADSTTSIRFLPPEEGKSIELADSWNLPNKEISAIRKKHFSFIFQNTNLMPNFTSGENMMVSLLIKGASKNEAKKEALKMMDRLSLEREIFSKKIAEISGGQKQRLAFVRAITADFSVLFGDEPTGNLDEKTSEELMLVLKEKTVEEGKTGVIVSHDLTLAEKFADMIIPITIDSSAPEGKLCGEVLKENILWKNASVWSDQEGYLVPDIYKVLNQHLLSQRM